MLDVFRFAWFAVRTFFGVIALILAAYMALYLFVKVLERGNVQQGHRPTTVSRTAKSTAPSCVRRMDRAFQADAATPPPLC
jgi:hypothetical protein